MVGIILFSGLTNGTGPSHYESLVIFLLHLPPETYIFFVTQINKILILRFLFLFLFLFIDFMKFIFAHVGKISELQRQNQDLIHEIQRKDQEIDHLNQRTQKIMHLKKEVCCYFTSNIA